ncbi:unnamed protein product [Miscanthus lutarioriparius]|uniref:Uncharacterized protein n=1 Tax=Miscanthus lutarioriparius TaxID=422564 RepID=A0A811RLW1_9POAL|nr:unnamed protein product [Miscanthus lutarioriparius]
MAPPLPPPPAMQPPSSNVTPAPLLPDAGASASEALQNLSLHVTHSSLGLATPVDGDCGGGSCSKPPLAPKKKSKSKSKRDKNSI